MFGQQLLNVAGESRLAEGAVLRHDEGRKRLEVQRILENSANPAVAVEPEELGTSDCALNSVRRELLEVGHDGLNVAQLVHDLVAVEDLLDERADVRPKCLVPRSLPGGIPPGFPGKESGIWPEAGSHEAMGHGLILGPAGA